ncbi:NADH ubiquinone oxidoreductase, 20 kDa subunit [Nostoc sp. NIES-3756]|jgi:NAD-reducing hydrogenase small subunit|uniref:NADH-quinone oxidoreductase subunit B family protein n=1 Tax=Nostoc sp. NIES-3756 TaxID=1751286 RepID=UPI0007226A3F|nr:oxidoreductase [Nostoc sp. NIES-3756]BAT55219.1 NADH ubiquinone oxidoreductase, 20 kDa subunit [Nostoc sp. NIES-3756]BAY37000.1 NADH ubiquinone oxidoreductase 20 kDa subunit [Nostoc sp. NIES-2111]
MSRLKLATVWLGGCSGCHMSFLDLDEWLIDLAAQADVVFSPFADIKEYPEGVDIVLVEGAIANEEHLTTIKTVRERSQVLISFGDCAVTGNVTALRNPLGSAEPVLQRCYIQTADINPQIPQEPGIVPPLLDRVTPVHSVVVVDIYLPGCPPSATRIRAVLEPLLRGETPHLAGREFIKFG